VDLPWVAIKLTTMALGMMKLNIFAWNQKLRKYVKMGNFGKDNAFFNKTKCNKKG